MNNSADQDVVARMKERQGEVAGFMGHVIKTATDGYHVNRAVELAMTPTAADKVVVTFD